MKARGDGRRDAPGEKVLKDRRVQRRRGRMGTSVNTNAPEPAASKMAFPVTCVAKSAPAAMAHPLTAAKSSATTATDVGSCPLSTNSLSVISFAAALSTSAR